MAGEAQALIEEVLESFRMVDLSIPFARGRVAAEINKAFGGLRKHTEPEYPACWDQGFQTCEEGPPVSRWVTDWSRG